MIIAIPLAAQSFVEPALVRLRYLYPNIIFDARADGSIEARDPAETEVATIARDILYAVYREKIYAETLSMRRALIEAVTRT